jgi:hypothetical protein
MSSSPVMAVSDYCVNHPNASSCNINSFSSELLAIMIAAVIVALIIFDVAWKFRFGARGPISRAFLAAGTAILRAVSRPRNR